MKDNRISTWFHCAACMRQLPAGTSPRQHARLEVGLTRHGLQVWCVRHELQVIFIDFDEKNEEGR